MAMKSGFAGVDSLLANRTKAMAKEERPSPIIKRRRTRRVAAPKEDSDGDERLQELIDVCHTEEEVAELKAAWATPAGRRKLEAEQRVVSSDDESSSPENNRRTKRRRLRKERQTKRPKRSRTNSRSKAATIEISDDEVDGNDHTATDSASGAGQKSGVATRRRKTRKQRQATVKSVPLPKKNGVLAERLNSRGAVPNVTRIGGRVTRASAAAKKQAEDRDKPTKDGTGRSRRRQKRSTSTSVSSDESEQEFHSDEEELEAADSDFSDDEAEEEIVVEEEEEEEDASDDDDFVDPEPDSVKKSKRRKGAKKNDRRKRTRPKDAFGSNAEELSAREQRARLDYLVKQSAEIARDLHTAMAEAVNTQRPSSAGLKSPSQKTGTQATEGSADADITAVKPSQEAGGADSSARVEEKFASPNAEGKELQPHQTDGVNWLLTLDAQGLNAILADEMGLGKTIQAIAFLASLVLSEKRGPHLVIAPKNVCDHWAAEVRTWYPGQINVVTHLGPADERLEDLQTILEEDNFDILVTSFEIALRDLFTRKRLEGVYSQYSRVLRAFRKVEFEYLIVDEAHRLKNDKSMLNMGIRNYQCAQRRLLLTGTPLSNDLKELWCLMNVLNPKIFSSKATFEAWFSAPFESRKGSKKGIMTHAEQSAIVDRLHTIIRPFFRRRVRADICPSFTSADEILIRCPMGKLQRALMLHFRKRADDRDASKNNILMAMRAVSSHPFISSNALFDGELSQANPRVVSNCGKFAFLHYSLPRLLAGGHRVLIFSQFRRALDFLEDLMDLLGIAYGRLDGLTTAEDRLSGLGEFNAPGSKLQVFLLSTRAGGVGINLQTADTVILFDSDWNPSADLQAVSRIQRIGQKKTVHIMRLVTEKSVDTIILETAKRKLRTQAVAVGAGKFNTSSGAALDQKMRQKDLEQLLQELDIRNFLPAREIDEQTRGPSSQSSPESVSPNRQQRSTQAKYFKEWGEQLLRPGETALPDVNQPPVWIDSQEDDGSIFPVWLREDANLIAAGKALDCVSRAHADHVYQETVQSIARVGAFSKKDRAARARRNIIVDIGSDLDSNNNENVSEDDPSISVEECSDFSTDEEFVPIPEIAMPATSEPRKGVVESFLQPVGVGKTPPMPLVSPAFNLLSPVGSYAPQMMAVAAPQPGLSTKSEQRPGAQLSPAQGSGKKSQQTPDAQPVFAAKRASPGNPPGSVAVPNKRNGAPSTKRSPGTSSQQTESALGSSSTYEFYGAPGQVAQCKRKGGTVYQHNPLKPIAAPQPMLPIVAVPYVAVPAPPHGRPQWSVVSQNPGVTSSAGHAGQSELSVAAPAGSGGPGRTHRVQPVTAGRIRADGRATLPEKARKIGQASSTRVNAERPRGIQSAKRQGAIGSAVVEGNIQVTGQAPNVRDEPGRPQGVVQPATAKQPTAVGIPDSQRMIQSTTPASIARGASRRVSEAQPPAAKRFSGAGKFLCLGKPYRTGQDSSALTNAMRHQGMQSAFIEHVSAGDDVALQGKLVPAGLGAHPRAKVPITPRVAWPRPTVATPSAARVAPVQSNEADQGSPLHCRNPRVVANRCTRITATDLRTQNHNSMPLVRIDQANANGIYSIPEMGSFNIALGSNPSVEDAKAACFTALVDRLQEATKVTDIDFLVDALLASGCNIDNAADYIYNRIS